MPRPRVNWTPQEVEQLKSLVTTGKHSFREIGRLMGRSKESVTGKAYLLGLNNGVYVQPSLYEHDRTFFSRITPETCYWAGIITTDGCISYNKGASVLGLWVAIKDLEHLSRWKAAIKATNPISRGHVKCSLSTRDPDALHEYCQLRLDSAAELVADLGRVFNITHNKTLRCPPPVLPDTLHQLCYLRGYIDGDGMITNSNQLGFVEINVCGSNREMIANIKDIVDSLDIPHIHPAKRPSLVSQRAGESTYYYSLRGFRAAVLFELLRRTPTPNLSRKWDNPKVLHHVDHWKAQTDRWPPESWFVERLTSSSTASYTTPPTPPPSPSVSL